MARTLVELQTARDSIIQQMSMPDSLSFGDRAVRSKPQADLEAALIKIDSEIAALTGGAPSRVFTVQTNRGLS